MTTERLSFRLGVSIPLSSVKSELSTRNFLIASAWETARLASLTAASSSASNSGSSRSCSGVASVGLPFDSSHPGSASSSRVISAPMNGRWSPTTMHWLTAGGKNVAPAVLEDLLLAPGDREEAVVVQLAEVAGVEEALGVDGLLRGVLVLPVPAHDDAAADEHLAVVGDAELDAGQR